MSNTREYVLTLSCKDVRGIVAAVSGFIAAEDGFIVESTQFGDASTDTFFMRMHFACGEKTPEDAELRKRFAERVGTPFNMDWHMHDRGKKQRVLIMVSKFGHCLNDLLHRYQAGTLPIEIPAVVSNHPDMQRLVAWHDIPYFFFPLEDKNKKAEQEQRILEVIERYDIDLVVLARYMQILSPELSKKLRGRAINIHHSFLPSFKGAKPYHQAHARGVKIIGATAHYVTEDLDEGPIIEQEVAHVNHTFGPEDLVAVGQDNECRVLARAVKYHIEHRVLLNGHKTVVFK